MTDETCPKCSSKNVVEIIGYIPPQIREKLMEYSTFHCLKCKCIFVDGKLIIK